MSFQREVRTTLRTPEEIAAECNEHARALPRWSYHQVMAAAEEKIRELMGRAEARQDTAADYRQLAYGVWLGWRALTSGCGMDAGDPERLLALTEHQG
ncbi:hypothetical protein LMG10661_00678 [Ralstonia syzygii subsp. syzygii]|nr:hypothetical protein LMG10661_00678 [Ralstonia syzygii subsp. syzygii]